MGEKEDKLAAAMAAWREAQKRQDALLAQSAPHPGEEEQGDYDLGSWEEACRKADEAAAAKRKANGESEQLEKVLDKIDAMDAAGTLKVITALELDATEFPPLKIIVPDLIVEGLTLFAARPKSGKSWMMLHAANAVANGGFTLGERHCIEGDVLYCALEDGPRRLKARQRKLGLKPNPRLSFIHAMPPLHMGALDVLAVWLGAHPDARLIVIDTLARVRPPKRNGAGAYEDDVVALRDLHRLAMDAAVAIVLIHHTRKEQGGDPFENVSGTNAMTGMVDTIVVLERANGSLFGLHATGREIEPVELAVEFNKRSCVWNVTADSLEAATMGEMRQQILTVLREAGEPLSLPAIAKRAGLLQVNIRMTLSRMVQDQQIRRTARGKYNACNECN